MASSFVSNQGSQQTQMGYKIQSVQSRRPGKGQRRPWTGGKKVFDFKAKEKFNEI